MENQKSKEEEKNFENENAVSNYVTSKSFYLFSSYNNVKEIASIFPVGLGGIKIHSFGKSAGGYDVTPAIKFAIGGVDDEYVIISKDISTGDPMLECNVNRWLRIKGSSAVAISGSATLSAVPPLVVYGANKVGINLDPSKEQGNFDLYVKELLKVSKIGSQNGLSLWGSTSTNGLPHLSINSQGKVGINLNVDNEQGNFNLYIKESLKVSKIGSGSDNGLLFWGSPNLTGTAPLSIDVQGNVGINRNLSIQQQKNLYDFFVNKGVLAPTYGLMANSNWVEKVFESDYSLMSLQDLKLFISENGHLPNIPTQESVAENGYELHDMNVKLLTKISELTSYVIELEDSIRELKERLVALENKIFS